MVVIKLILLLLFALVLYQDHKHRMVHWFLFPLIGLFGGLLHYDSTLPELFLASILLNLFFVTLMLAMVFLYCKFKLRMKLDEAIGLGDVLLFMGLAFTFSSLTFLVIFVFGLLFSLIVHLVVKHGSREKTIPLAGYLSLFFALTYIISWTGMTNSLYIF